MTQHHFILRFDTAEARDAATEAAEHAILPVDLIVSPDVWGAPDPETGEAELITEAEMLSGFWALAVADAVLWDDAAAIAELDPVTGAASRWRDDAIEGARVSPILAGMPATPIALVQPVDPAPAMPPITARQIRLALLGAGLLDRVEPTLQAMDEPARSAALVEWEYASQYTRDHHLITALAGALGLSEAQVDTMWAGAVGL